MKTFETPVVDVRKFDLADILTASTDPSVPSDPNVEPSSEEEDTFVYPCV